MRFKHSGYRWESCQKAGALKFGRIIEARAGGRNRGKHKTTYASDMQ
jgi:hypothetical protein